MVLSWNPLRRRSSVTSVNQLRLDPLSGRWVTVATDRAQRQALFVPRQPTLDTLEGFPARSARASRTRRPPPSRPTAPRAVGSCGCVPNRYPAFEGDAPFVVENRGPVFTEAPASGIHEVLVLSPDHDATMASLSDEQVVARHARHPRPRRGAREHLRTALQPGDHQPRPPGRRLDRAPARPAARDPVRAAESSSTSRPASPGSPAVACSARRRPPRSGSATGSCRRPSTP